MFIYGNSSKVWEENTSNFRLRYYSPFFTSHRNCIDKDKINEGSIVVLSDESSIKFIHTPLLYCSELGHRVLLIRRAGLRVISQNTS